MAGAAKKRMAKERQAQRAGASTEKEPATSEPEHRVDDSPPLGGFDGGNAGPPQQPILSDPARDPMPQDLVANINRRLDLGGEAYNLDHLVSDF
ncbi:MAG: hypothetical protein M1819_003062 [Sarea resinae]|nr:MAG: hypothetical protein M1819_003062 [Sarea resinae]